MEPSHKTQRKMYFVSIFGVMLSILIIYFSSCKNNIDQKPPVVKANPTVKRGLMGFRRIDGTDYMIAAIGSNTSSGDNYFSSYESGYRGDVYNYVFLNATTDSIKRLLPSNYYLITGTSTYPERKEGDQSSPPTQWIVYSVINRDSNGDKQLTSDDHLTLAESDVSGENYTEIIGGIEKMFGRITDDKNRLILIYQKDGKKYHSILDLPSKKLVSTKEFPSLGEEEEKAEG